MSAPRIRYQANRKKIIEAIVWLASNRPSVTFFNICKLLYFADKLHLELYGRPILGDRYIAMTNGPVPSLTYDILKRDDFLDAETLELAAASFSVHRNGHPAVQANREPDLALFSRSDIECLDATLGKYSGASVRRLWRESHQDPAYIEAETNGEMDYALMIGDHVEDRQALIEEIREQAQFVVL